MTKSPIHNIRDFWEIDEQKMNRLTAAHPSVIVQSEPGGYLYEIGTMSHIRAVLLGGSSVQVGDKSD